MSYFTGTSELISRVALRTDGPGRKRNEHPDRGMTQSDSLMIISLAVAENITGAGVTRVYFVLNHSLITSLPF